MRDENRQMTGSEIVVQSLLDIGVDTIFGYTGGKVIALFDALSRTPLIKRVMVRHEQGGTHAADGYARVTGRPGVVLVTSGPGATNTVTGIANAFMDSIVRARPSAAKGGYIQSVTVSSTMGPGISLDPNLYRRRAA